MNGKVTINPKILVGKPVIKGTRIPVNLIINLLNHGYDVERICEAYPILEPADIRAALGPIPKSDTIIAREVGKSEREFAAGKGKKLRSLKDLG